MSNIRDKFLQEHMKRIVLEKSLFDFKIFPIGYSNPADGLSNFWKYLTERNVNVKKIIGLDGCYGLQLSSGNGSAYINEQLKKFEEQENA